MIYNKMFSIRKNVVSIEITSMCNYYADREVFNRRFFSINKHGYNTVIRLFLLTIVIIRGVK